MISFSPHSSSSCIIFVHFDICGVCEALTHLRQCDTIPRPGFKEQREQSEREQVLDEYRAKIREHREVEARLKRMREDVKGLGKRYQKTEDDLGALQSVGQIIGDVLKRLDNERFIVKASSGPRYVVGCRTRLSHGKLKPGTRVALDMTTLTIMRVLPREVDPTVFHMQASEEDGGVSFADIGGLNEQIRELREVIELPLTNPELFTRVGIKVRLFRPVYRVA